MTAGAVRIEAADKASGRARYAVEYPQQHPAYAWPVQARVARGRVTWVDAGASLADPGVLAILWHGNAPRLGDTGDPALAVLQSADVAFRGQVVALVVAETAETAREVAETLPVRCDERAPDAVLTAEHPSLYTPERVNGGHPPVSELGDPDGVFRTAPVRVDETYRTPAMHNNPMEPHGTTAVWEGARLVVYDSNQGGHAAQQALAKAFELPPDAVRVVNAHVGGGFGAKGTPRPVVVLAAMAAQFTGRPVKLAATRQMQFSLVGYRTPTIQRVRLGADRDGRLLSVGHDAISQTGTLAEFAEQTAVATRHMYAAAHRRTTHRVARLDVPVPSWMRAPGECPGMFALESAMDELAVLTAIDPVELRIRNEPDRDPERDLAFSSRNLVGCLRAGAERFGWAGRAPRPGTRREGRWLVGTGVAASTYPVLGAPATARAEVHGDGRYSVGINATDIGTGARTVLTELAAEALGVPLDRVRVDIGDTALPPAGLAGGSMGTRSWGWAVTKACDELARRVAAVGGVPIAGLRVTASTEEDLKALPAYSRHAFGAQFAEVRVDTVTCEVRVPRLVGVFAAGRIVNPRTARSQLIGGMTMGLSMALHEEGLLDPSTADYANHDLATYHVAAHADVGEIDVSWLDERDPHLGGIGAKGIGEIGVVGTAAAVANAVHHATGIRVRDLPLTPHRLLPHLPDL